ncbi:hypothetical protein [Kitasatospora sp. NPDC059327]|uniref:hypothetical protein n=1 Tax=Kitasatospora sp. NPDC059327 TaxID=3346803 RepID=UPI0036864DB2
MALHAEPADARAAGSMCARIAGLADEAARHVCDGRWDLSGQDVAVARATAEGLAAGTGGSGLPCIERLEHLREALAHLAVGTARTHGRLAWFLAQASTVLAPVLQWRAMAAEPGRAFGTRLPDLAELTDAEHAVRLLHTTITRVVLAGRALADEDGAGSTV